MNYTIHTYMSIRFKF